ncbi:MAG: hypothetical protein IH605_02840 [Burkholderiales bacterium]|nr:hypothetical protein [Burkholderiales bacterium]
MTITRKRTRPTLIFGLGVVLLAGCSALLPRGETVADSPWENFEDAQETFDRIVPHQTTVEELRALKLDPMQNPNITLLNYSDVLRRFIPSPSTNTEDLDSGVQECIRAKTACKGYEVDQKSLKRRRYGNFWADFLNFKRKVDIVGWRFNGVILIKDDVVVYKLTGGQPVIHEHEENKNPLGPLQGIGESRIFR